MKAPAALVALVLAAVPVPGRAAALPAGWSAGEIQTVITQLPEPACCALGRMHPCCAHQRSFDASRPHQVADRRRVDLATLPEARGNGCVPTFTAPPGPLPPAIDEPAHFGLRVFGEGRPGPIDQLPVRATVRVLPMGHVGEIGAANAGVWWAGREAAFTTRNPSALDWGVTYRYGAPWKRVDRLWFRSLQDIDHQLHYRAFEGSLDIVTGDVGARCFVDTPLAPLLDGWVHGFVAEHDGERELHVVMPKGRVALLSGGARARGRRDAFFADVVLPLGTPSAVAIRGNARTWSKVDGSVPDPHYLGVLSVHVVPGLDDAPPTVVVARERSRNPSG